MKLCLGLVLAAMLLAGSASAQHANFGIKGGLNFYNIDNDNNVKNSMKTGFHAGLLWHIHMSQQFAIQPELVYSVQGIKYSGNDKLSLGYVNVPVMFMFMFNNGFRLEAGPQVGFLAQAKSEVSGNSEDVKANLETLDFAIGVGLGYISSSGFGFDARYNHGLSNINTSGTVTSTNRGYQLGVFYQFSHR
jgi:opacity protein-like surface antigen